MNGRIVIPMRGPEGAKTRLTEILDPATREALVRSMFDHVLDVAVGFAGARNCWVVSRSPEILALAAERGARALVERSRGLNMALEQTAKNLKLHGEGPILVLLGDLPHVTHADLTAITEMQADVVCARDLGRTGTNALWLRHPGLIPYRFGRKSFAAHREEATARGLRLQILDRPGLALDVDDPRSFAAHQAFAREACEP